MLRRVNRARVSRVLLVVGLVALFFHLAPHFPRDTQLDLRLGERHADVVALELALAVAGTDELLRTVSLRYPAGAPRAVQHATRLPTGEIELRAQLSLRDGRILELERSFRTPEEGLPTLTAPASSVRIDLSD
jgi:hypothetical protein